MTDSTAGRQQAEPFRAVLTPYRSLSSSGFVILMTVIGLASFAAGLVFFVLCAWPVFGFFWLDALLIYAAFKLNYRAGRLFETVELTPQQLTLTRVHPSGARESFAFNPYWVRVLLSEQADGRTELRLASHGREYPLARFLTDDERREVACALRGALGAARVRSP